MVSEAGRQSLLGTRAPICRGHGPRFNACVHHLSFSEREAALGAISWVAGAFQRLSAGFARRTNCKADVALWDFRSSRNVSTALFLYNGQPGGFYFAKLDGGPPAA